MIKSLQKLVYKIRDYFYYKSPIYINLNFYKLIREYIKCCHIFKSPIVVKYKLINDEDSLGYHYDFLEKKCNNKWLHINCVPLGWKTKFYNYEFESFPYLTIVLFNKIRYVFGLEGNLWNIVSDKIEHNSELYYETILTYLYDTKDIEKIFLNNIWKRPIFQKNEYKVITNIHITNFNMFRTKYKKYLAKKLEKISLNN